MDKQRSRMSLPTRPPDRESPGKLSQEKNLADLMSPSHFDSGTVSDMDLKFESDYNIDDDKEDEGGGKTQIKEVVTEMVSAGPTWSDSGIHLDSGLGFESDLDIQSPSQCPDKDIKCVVEEDAPQEQSESDICVFQDTDGDSPLHLAVVHGDPHLVFRILSLYPEYLNVTNHLSQTPLHLAVLLDFVRIVRRLVVCGAHLHTPDHQGDTPLHLACRLGHLESLKALTIPVITKEVKEAGLTQVPHPQVLSRINTHLMQQRNYEGLTCTHLAAASSHKILEYVLQCGADINAKEGKSGRTILHMCVEKGHLELVQFLVTVCKADVNARNYAKQTPLHLAHLQKRYRTDSTSRSQASMMIRLLRKYGGEPHELTSDNEEEDSENEED